jgi:hypothetical protein
MLHSTFSILGMQWPVGQWIPFTGDIVTSYLLVPIKAMSEIVTVYQSLWILRTVRMMFGASRLFLVYLPASSQTLWHCAWIFLFVYLVSCIHVCMYAFTYVCKHSIEAGWSVLDPEESGNRFLETLLSFCNIIQGDQKRLCEPDDYSTKKNMQKYFKF